MGLRERLLVSKSNQRIELCIQCNTPSLGRLILARTGRVRGRSGKTGSLCHHFLGTSRSSHNKISSQRARALEAFGVHGPRKPDGTVRMANMYWKSAKRKKLRVNAHETFGDTGSSNEEARIQANRTQQSTGMFGLGGSCIGSRSRSG